MVKVQYLKIIQHQPGLHAGQSVHLLIYSIEISTKVSLKLLRVVFGGRL